MLNGARLNLANDLNGDDDDDDATSSIIGGGVRHITLIPR